MSLFFAIQLSLSISLFQNARSGDNLVSRRVRNYLVPNSHMRLKVEREMFQ